MAEAVVGVLICKLSVALANGAAAYGASLLCKGASALNGLFREIRKAERELHAMKDYLHDAEKLKDTNNTSGIFINKIRDLAFRIEDVIDEFTYKLKDKKHGGFLAKIKKRVNHVKIWRRLVLELCEINAELEDAARKRGIYDVEGAERYDGGSNHHARSSLCFARDEDLVAIEANADNLKRWLVGDLEERYKIITVWGMGGVGKTTLVEHVYKIVKEDFDIAAWVTVSKTFQVEDLLKKIAREFGISFGGKIMEMRSLVEAIRNHLKGKRYILVLDDVWEKDVWINIMDVFPSNCISRFILTSRIFEVASLAANECAIKLEPLEEDNSWKLFCNVAFRNTDDKRCPSELQDCAAMFLQKCEGLPIAIACIGCLLSCKPPTLSAWKNVYNELELQSTKNAIPGVDTILKVSLEDLPYELKNCFLHCAIFPEDCEMYRRRLIRQWITARFIKGKENKTLEQVAEGYLNELVNRSLLQVVKKNEFGRVKCCRMHDVVRHLALNKAEQECFGVLYESSGTLLVENARRLSIQSSDITPLRQSGATHLRAIHTFMNDVDIALLKPMLASSNLLPTLDLQGTQIKVLPDEVFNLFNLRFLGLRYTGVEIIPEELGRLQNLEVLDAFKTALQSLPKGVAKLKKLRYLYACVQYKKVTVTNLGGVKMPRGIRNLTGLHALQKVKATIESLSDVSALTELRTFAVSDVTSELSENLCSAITSMCYLAHLSVTASNENEVLPWEALRLPETLSKLDLGGQLEKKRLPQILSSWSHLKNLARLTLIGSKLDEDSFPSLVVLSGLCLLELDKAYDGKKLYFPSPSFPRLRRLDILGPLHLNQIEISKGALESLGELVLAKCPEMKLLPRGIENLASLEELHLYDIADELVDKLRHKTEANQSNEELMKISHIKKVVVRLTEKNIQERIR